MTNSVGRSPAAQGRAAAADAEPVPVSSKASIPNADRIASRIWAVMQIFCVTCWCSVWLSEVRPSFDLPQWLLVASQAALIIAISRSIWRAA